MARRGLPARFISDNAKTFKAASKDLRKIVRSQEVTRYMVDNRVNWNLIVDMAPWWGGLWERLVKNIKLCFKKTIGRATVTYDELAAILTEVESVINARPINYVYDDVESVSYALTPSHLINGRMITAMPNDSHYDVASTSSTLSWRTQHQRNVRREEAFMQVKQGLNESSYFLYQPSYCLYLSANAKRTQLSAAASTLTSDEENDGIDVLTIDKECPAKKFFGTNGGITVNLEDVLLLFV